MGITGSTCVSDHTVSVTHINIPANSGWMDKKGQLMGRYKSRYFELFPSGKLVYYTDEGTTRKGALNLSTIIGFNVVDLNTFEVFMPERIECFRCKHQSDRDCWIEAMKSMEHCRLLHDADYPNDRDYFNLSANRNILKLISKMGGREGEKILYSDRITITNNKYNRQRSTVLMLTTGAIYHLEPNNEYKKCIKRIPGSSVEWCILLNPEELCIEDVVYMTECRNMTMILRALREADIEVLFYREEDGAKFHDEWAKELYGNKEDGASLSRTNSDSGDSVASGESQRINDSLLLLMTPSYGIPHGMEVQDSYARYRSDSESTVFSACSLLSSLSTLQEPVPSLRDQEPLSISSNETLSAKDFAVLSVIGRGRFGTTCTVRKKDNGSVFAMKIVKNAQIIVMEQERNIHSERDVLKSIDHPFLMNLRHEFQSESKFYFVMDYYRGGNLDKHLELRGSFCEEEVKFIAAQIALAIGCLHSHGVVYRDLKPDNILMDDIGNCCLIHSVPSSLRIPEVTTDYMAPELVEDLPFDRNVDWWSLGILVFELTVGVVPSIYQQFGSFLPSQNNWMNSECKKFVDALLQRTKYKRLGYNLDVEDIKAHQWFDGTDWNEILQKTVVPPFRPKMSGDSMEENKESSVGRRHRESISHFDSFSSNPDRTTRIDDDDGDDLENNKASDDHIDIVEWD